MRLPDGEVPGNETAALPASLAEHGTALVAEHESAKTPDATLESTVTGQFNEVS
jgi:hypothetical protein